LPHPICGVTIFQIRKELDNSLPKKLKWEVFVIVTVLFLSILISCLQVSYTSAQISSDSASSSNKLSIILNYESFSLTKHKMSATELQQYKNGAGVYQEGQNYNNIVNGHGTGLSSPTSSEWIAIAKDAYVVDRISGQTPPDAVDLSVSEWFPPIGDQGQQGSCASFAVGYYCKTFQEAKEHSWNLTNAQWISGSNNGNISADYQSQVMSPAFIYNLINNGTDGGSDFETPIQLVSNVGISSWQNMPYDWQDYQSWPSENAWAQASLYRSNSTFGYQYLYVNTTQGATSLKNWLAEDNLATIAIDAYDNLLNFTKTSDQDLFTTDNYINGDQDHAATIVGYNDSFTYMENGTLHNGAFKIANSWGIGDNWETIPDGCYWISYEAMKELSTSENPVILFGDLVGYQPQILATFNIAHAARSDCNITFGLGTPNAPIVTKNFTDFVFGGALPFCQNNIVFDLTEFQDYITSPHNQQFFMKVYDVGPYNGGTISTGTINYFAIGNTYSLQAPTQTSNNHYVNLTLNYSTTPTTFNVSPESGPPSGTITLNGSGFAGSSINISYLNPLTNNWIPITDNLTIPPENFSYPTHAPDLMQNNIAGDNSPLFNKIVFRAQDNSNGISYNTTIPYTEWRRGLTQIGNSIASGLYGNNTDLSSTLFVENEQSITISGKWFNPGTATILWDNTISLGTAPIDTTGLFNANVQVPNTTAGPHNLTINDGSYAYCINLTRLPKITNNYTNFWRTADFIVNLTPDYSGNEIYYRINYGSICNVSTHGQPFITTESTSNMLEYWSTWNVYGTNSVELSHIILTEIKLDKTMPQALLQINGGSESTTSNVVTLTLTATDSTSGVNQIRFSNDNTWNQATWEPFTSSKSWQLTSGNGEKTVYYELQDKAGLSTTGTASITLNIPQVSPTQTLTPTSTAKPSTNPSPTTTPTSTIYPINYTDPLPPTTSTSPTQTSIPNLSSMSLNVPVIGAIILICLVLIGLLVKRNQKHDKKSIDRAIL
jgi:hypothetical protein